MKTKSKANYPVSDQFHSNIYVTLFSLKPNSFEIKKHTFAPPISETNTKYFDIGSSVQTSINPEISASNTESPPATSQ